MATPTPTQLATQYGYSEGFFRADPELWALFQKAKAGQWDVTKFQGEFMKTAWFRSRQASIRQWSDLEIRDPAEADAKIQARMAEMSDQFTQLGVQIGADELKDLATQSLKYAWSNAQMQNVLADHVNYLPGQTGGGIAAMETHIKDLAYQYGVAVTPDQTNDWIKNLVSQTWTDENLQDVMRDAAKSKYAAYSKELDTGRTMRDIAGQHIATFSQLMEVDPGSVSLDDPILANALQGTIDPKTGQPQGQSVFQMSQAIRRDQRWLKTQNARDSMMSTAFGIGRDMGLI